MYLNSHIGDLFRTDSDSEPRWLVITTLGIFEQESQNFGLIVNTIITMDGM